MQLLLLPVDAMGIPWLGNYVYNHGNLINDLLDNVVLESTGVLQKTRIYEMSSNKTFHETLGFLIVRDNAHQNAFAKALETLGMNWGNVFPVPNYDINKYPEFRKIVDMGYSVDAVDRTACLMQHFLYPFTEPSIAPLTKYFCK